MFTVGRKTKTKTNDCVRQASMWWNEKEANWNKVVRAICWSDMKQKGRGSLRTERFHVNQPNEKFNCRMMRTRNIRLVRQRQTKHPNNFLFDFSIFKHFALNIFWPNILIETFNWPYLIEHNNLSHLTLLNCFSMDRRWTNAFRMESRK